MAKTIKSYDAESKSWVIAGGSDANSIYVTDPNLPGANVEDTLESFGRDIATLKSNVGWLAKYGGGGGGGTGGGGTAVQGTITVNGLESNNNLTLDDAGLTISVQSNSSTIRWKITATANNGSTVIASINNATSLTISRTQWESLVKSTSSLNVTAYNASTLTTLYWNGRVYLSSVVLTCPDTTSTAFNNLEDWPIKISYTLGSTGSYKLFVNDVAYDNGALYNALTGSLQVRLGTIRDLIADTENPLGAGSNKLTFKLQNVDNEKVYGECVCTVILTSDVPIIDCRTVSKSESEPTDIVYYDSPVSVAMPMTVYYDSTSGYTYKIIVDDNDASAEYGSSCSYNKAVTSAAANVSLTGPGRHKLTICVRDTRTETVYRENFYANFVSPTAQYLKNDWESYKLMDFTANNAIISGSQWKPTGYEYTANITNINAACAQMDPNTHSIRLQNAAYLTVPMAAAAFGNKGYNIPVGLTEGDDVEFTLEICFSCDYHPDDDRIIFKWADLMKTTDGNIIPARGIMIRDHDVYIGSSKATTLEDNNIINLAITYKNEIGKETGKVFLYVDGVIEYVSEIQNNAILPGAGVSVPMYIGGMKDDVFAGDIDTWFTDMNIYRWNLYHKCLSPYDILCDYLNTLAMSHYHNGSPDMNYIKEGLHRNFIKTDANGNPIMNGSVLYTHDDNTPTANEFDNNSESLSDKFNIGNFVDISNIPCLNKDLLNYDIPIPILFLNIAGWKWEDFIQPNSPITETTAQFQYYDQKLGDNMVKNELLLTCTVEPQGTSTLADYIKNLNINFPAGTVFSPKDTWFPESTYTLKADIVDSSHSLNASIGKFVNQEFGLTNLDAKSSFYPFSDRVQSAFVDGFRKSEAKKTFPNATLKHGVEGFPVFVIIRFNNSTTKTLGIYQFILGRSSPRNLGYEMITKVIDKSGEVPVENPVITEYPLVNTNMDIEVTSIPGVWIEFNRNDPFSIDWQSMTDEKLTTAQMTYPFWQDSGDYYNEIAEIKYSSHPSYVKGSDVSNMQEFMKFVRNVMKLPVTYKRYSRTASGIQYNSSSGGQTYPKYSYVDKKWVDTGSSNQMSEFGDPLASVLDYLDIESYATYYATMMLFGLIDNFQKNMPIKIYQKENGQWEVPLLGIYDTDTGIGQDNQAGQGVPESVWAAALSNNNQNIEEVNPSSGGAINGTANKLWLMDHYAIGYVKNGNQRPGLYSNAWVALINHFQHESAAGDKGPVSWDKLADYYVDNYFLPQTEGCGELLFNLTYISKYITKYKSGTGGTPTNQINKLHGRRKYQVRRWLKNRIIFLNSMFKAIGTYNNSSIEATTAHTTAVINAGTGPEAIVTTNCPVVLGYANAKGDVDTYVFCPKNVETSIYYGADRLTISDPKVIHPLTNPDQIIKIGRKDDENPLYNMVYSNVSTGSLPYLTEYDCSTPTRAASSPNHWNTLTGMDPGYMSSKFCRKLEDGSTQSELRLIDFRNTMPMAGEYNYELNLKEGFTKLQQLYINNSCITGLTFPEGVSIKDFDISNSNIVNMNVDSQNFITSLNLRGCGAMQSLTISNCNNLQELNLDSTNSSLRSVTISSCPNLKKFTCIGNNSVETIFISAPSCTSVEVTDCNKLTRIDVDTTNLVTLDAHGCSVLNTLNFMGEVQSKTTTINLRNTSVTLAGHKLPQDVTGLEKIVDLYNFSNLANFSISNNSAVQFIQFANELNNPISLTNPFTGCASLERVYGHFTLKNVGSGDNNGMFRGCAKFTLLGDVDTNTTWATDSHSTPRKIINADFSWNTPLELITGTTENTVTSSTENTWGSYTRADLFRSGKKQTNIYIPSNGSDTSWNYMFYQTKCNAFDIYYVLNMLAVSKVNYKVSGSYTWDSLQSPAFDWAYGYVADGDNSGHKGNNPNRYMFWGCDKISSVVNWFSTGVVWLKSPTVDSAGNVSRDNGLFSPLTGLTYYYNMFGSNLIYSRYLWRRKDGKYAVQSMQYMRCTWMFDRDDWEWITYDNYTKGAFFSSAAYLSHTGDFTDLLKDLTSLQTISYDCWNARTIRYSTITIPYHVTQVNVAFNSTYGTGTIDIPSIFQAGSNGETPRINVISCSFRCGGEMATLGEKPVFKIYEGMFNSTPNITHLGYTTDWYHGSINDEYSFGGAGMTKTIYGSDGVTLATEWPYRIFDDIPNLVNAAGFFANVTNTSFTTKVSLPGNMFSGKEDASKNNTKLKEVGRLFYNVNFDYDLTSNGFKDCPGLNNVQEMFYHDLTQTSRSKIEGSIPYHFLYHGSETRSSVTNILCDWVAHSIQQKNIVTRPLDYGDTTDSTYESSRGTNLVRIETVTPEPTEEIPVPVPVITYYYPADSSTVVYLKSSDMCFYTTNDFSSVIMYTEPWSESQHGWKDPVRITDPNDDPMLYKQDGVWRSDPARGDYKAMDGYTCDVENAYKFTYSMPLANIINAKGLFNGCINLQYWSENLNPAENQELNPNYIPSKWIYKYSSGKWNKISNDENIRCQYIGSWCYNGNPESLIEMSVDRSMYYYFNPDNSTVNCLSVPEKFNEKMGLAGKDSGLFYMCAPDLLRYMRDDVDTDVSYLFNNCGLDIQYPNGITTQTEGSQLMSKGITGRIPPHLLYNLSKIKTVSHMFTYCRRLSSYKDNTNTVYQIPPTFFSYSPNITDLTMAFSGLCFQEGTNLDIFGGISNNNALDIRGIFAACIYCTPDKLWEISNVFSSKNFSGGKMSGAFSSYVMNLTNTEASGYVERDNQYRYVIKPSGSNFHFGQNFNINRLGTNKTYCKYTYYSYGDQADDSAIPRVRNNYSDTE